jgi:hypothetical protein
MASKSTAPRAKGTQVSPERRAVARTRAHPTAILPTIRGEARSPSATCEIPGMDAKATRFMPTYSVATSSPDLNLPAQEPACLSGVHRINGVANAPFEEGRAPDESMSPVLEQVTLIVYGWKSVEPGTLSWVFPSVGAALAAARAMTNAVKWAIVTGSAQSLETSIDVARVRASGALLFER